MRASIGLVFLLAACGAPAAEAPPTTTPDPVSDVRRPGPPRIGYLTGNGTLVTDVGVFTRAHPEYEHAMLDPAASLPDDLDAVVVMGSGQLDAGLVERIAQLVEEGGGLAVLSAGGTVSADATPTFRPATAHASLLSRWNVEISQTIVLDQQCGRVPMRTSIGVRIPLPYPPAVAVEASGRDAAHPITRSLGSVTAFFVSPVTSPPGTSVMHTSAESWAVPGPATFEIRGERDWARMFSGAPTASSIAAAFSAGRGRVVVVGTDALIRDPFLPATTTEATRAFSLFGHAILAWLVRDESFEAYAATLAAEDAEAEDAEADDDLDTIDPRL